MAKATLLASAAMLATAYLTLMSPAAATPVFTNVFTGVIAPMAVPEPPTLPLLVIGLVGLAMILV